MDLISSMRAWKGVEGRRREGDGLWTAQYEFGGSVQPGMGVTREEAEGRGRAMGGAMVDDVVMDQVVGEVLELDKEEEDI